jgi:hypothetical protein
VDVTPREETASRLERLTALRDSQESALAGEVATKDFASLSREYRATLAEIAELEPKKAEGDGIDEIAKRRAARRTSPAKGSSRAKRSS